MSGVDPNTDAVVRAVWGEARGEPALGQQAVASVIMNRANQSGAAPAQVVAAPGQFEGYNGQAQSLSPSDPSYQAVLANVAPVVSGQADDPTGGATQFYSPTAQAALGRPAPEWANGPSSALIGKHAFYAPDAPLPSPADLVFKGKPVDPNAPASGDGATGDDGLPTPEQLMAQGQPTDQPAGASGPSAPYQSPTTLTDDQGLMPNPKLDPTKGILQSDGTYSDPRDPHMKRNKDGSIAYLGEPSTYTDPVQGNNLSGLTVNNGPPEININATAHPADIADYLKAHPNLAVPPDQDPQWQKAVSDAQAINKSAGGQNAGTALTGAFNPYVEGAANYVVQGTKDLIDYAQGKTPQTTPDYAARAMGDVVKGGQDTYDAQHPYLATAAGLAGGLAFGPEGDGVNFLANAPELVKGAATVSNIGGVGALYGAAEAPEGHHLQGAVGGAASALATAGVIKAGGTLVRPLANAATDAIASRVEANPARPFLANAGSTADVVPGMESSASPNVARQAQAYVGKLAQSAPSVNPALDAAADGKPVMLAEALGKTGQTGLGALARRAGQTGDTLSANLQERAANAPQRIMGDFENASGVNPAAAQGDIDGLVEQGRAAAAPLYVKAFDAPVNRTAELASVMQEPEVQKAVALAVRKVGTAALEPARVVNPDTGAYVMDPNTHQPVIEHQPTALTLDLAKKYLGQMVERDPFTNQPIMAGEKGIGNGFVLDNLKRFTTALAGDKDGAGAAIPGYRQALDTSGDYLSLQKAFQMGQAHMTNSNVPAAAVADTVAGLSPPELQAYRGGMANKVFNLDQQGSLKPSKFSAPIIKGKLTAALGAEPAAAFLKSAANEKLLAMSAARMMPGNGSPTAEFANAMGEQDGRSPLADFAIDVGQGVLKGQHPRAAVVAGLMKGANGLAAGLKTPGMSVPVRDEAGRILQQQMTRDELNAYLKAISARNAGKGGVPVGVYGDVGGEVVKRLKIQ